MKTEGQLETSFQEAFHEFRKGTKSYLDALEAYIIGYEVGYDDGVEHGESCEVSAL